MMNSCSTTLALGLLLGQVAGVSGAGVITVTNLSQLAEVAGRSNQTVKVVPGVYRLADYLTPAVLQEIQAGVDRTQSRPPVPMFMFRGDHNRFDLREVVFEIDTTLYAKLPGSSYVRCLIISGQGNHFDGLTVRNTGPQRGSGGNILSIAGASNTLENVTLHVSGSYPYGYGDLFGKGGPNLLGLQKQSGIQILGEATTLRRCKVFSRAFGHCFYIQGGHGSVIEDCYAEGEVRATTEMLAEANGPAFDLGFRSIYENRDGRYVITPGYTKSLVEDGFRTYGNAGNVALVNCVAVNTRAGFEIGARDDSPRKTVIENCLARGCERGFLLGSQVIVRRSRGDITHGPLLYLRGGRGADVELELAGGMPASTVHALATIAGSNHVVRLGALPGESFPRLPVMFGFGMPDHGEMSSPIRPAPTANVTLINRIPGVPILTSTNLQGCVIETEGKTLTDEELRRSPGQW